MRATVNPGFMCATATEMLVLLAEMQQVTEMLDRWPRLQPTVG